MELQKKRKQHQHENWKSGGEKVTLYTQSNHHLTSLSFLCRCEHAVPLVALKEKLCELDGEFLSSVSFMRVVVWKINKLRPGAGLKACNYIILLIVCSSMLFEVNVRSTLVNAVSICNEIFYQKKLFARSDRVKGVDFHPTEPWVLSQRLGWKRIDRM